MPEAKTMLPIVRQACDAYGGVSALAGKLGISRGRLYDWPRVPAEMCLPIERATRRRVTRYDLRPDLYPPVED